MVLGEGQAVSPWGGALGPLPGISFLKISGDKVKNYDGS